METKFNEVPELTDDVILKMNGGGNAARHRGDVHKFGGILRGTGGERKRKAKDGGKDLFHRVFSLFGFDF